MVFRLWQRHGFYSALIGVLNVILLSDRRLMAMRLLNAVGLFLSVISILLIGNLPMYS